MSAVPLCFVCDQPVASPYAPEAYCERCKQGCPVCGGDVAFCGHDLPELLTECVGDPLIRAIAFGTVAGRQSPSQSALSRPSGRPSTIARKSA
jgi:hypothetical protein